jgi:predicted GNAT family acetyltransferase
MNTQPAPDSADPVVEHRPELHCFELLVRGLRCHASYRLAGGVMTIYHTEVPQALEGRGLAAQLVQAALDWARAQQLIVKPTCSYVRAYMRRHPETQDLLGL